MLPRQSPCGAPPLSQTQADKNQYHILWSEESSVVFIHFVLLTKSISGWGEGKLREIKASQIVDEVTARFSCTAINI